MTTRTERIQRVTYEHSHAADLAAAHNEAREQWQAAAAETAGEFRAFADFLHELDVPGLMVLADDLAAERMAETQEWVVPSFPDAVEVPSWRDVFGIDPDWTGDLSTDQYIRHQRGDALPLLPAPFDQGPADDENRPGRGWIPRRPDDILGELYKRTAPEDEPVLLALGTEATHIRSAPDDDQRRDWREEVDAFKADVREMWRDARQGLLKAIGRGHGDG